MPKSRLKALARAIYRRLPFQLQVPLARNNPEMAFYIDKRPRHLEIDYYLGKYRVGIDAEVDIERRMLSGRYESDTLAVISRLVKRGDVCLDIGANVGAITLALADLAGPEGRVEAFEPGPEFFARLKRNIALNPEISASIRSHPIGLSDRPGKLKWQASRVYTGTASMYGGVHDSSLATVELEVAALDSFAPIQELAQIDFIKIDVDGLEQEILNGARGLLARHRPILYVETTLWNEEMSQAAKGIELLLLDLGYELYRIQPKSYELVPTRYPDFSMNTVAIHRP